VHLSCDDVKEYELCSDPVGGASYFITKYLHINHHSTGITKVTLRDYQIDMIDAVSSKPHNITLCPRQLGCTMVYSAYLLWYVMFTPNVRAVGITCGNSSAMDYVDRMLITYNLLPNFLKNSTSRTKHSITINNGSMVTCSSSAVILKGMTVNLIHFDNMAFLPEVAKLYMSILPALSTYGQIILSSTKNNDDDDTLFDKEWTAAKTGKSTFVPLRIKWNADPSRTDEWARKEANRSGLSIFTKEYLCT
jgi:hypothetical protein